MDSSAIVLVLLGIATACLLAITGTVLITTAQLRATLRRLDALLPDAGQALANFKQAGRQVRRLLTRTDAITEQVEHLVRGICEAAAQAMDRLPLLRHGLWRMGAEPRSHHRNGKGRREGSG